MIKGPGRLPGLNQPFTFKAGNCRSDSFVEALQAVFSRCSSKLYPAIYGVLIILFDTEIAHGDPDRGMI